MNESRKQSGAEQTNPNENTDTSIQSFDQSNNRENPKRTRSHIKNGDNGDDQENTTNNNDDDQLTKDSTKRSRRHERRRDNDDDEEEDTQQPQPAIQSSIVRAEPKEREQRRSSPTRQKREHRNESKHHRSTNNKHDENETPSHKRDHDESHTHRRRRSQTPPPSSSRVRSVPTDNKNESFNDPTSSPSATDPQEDATSILPTSHTGLSTKRRNRWENDDDGTGRHTKAQNANVEDELRTISQTSTGQPDPTTQTLDIPQHSDKSIVTDTTTTTAAAIASKSKWDNDEDEDEMSTDSVQQNQTQPEP